MKCIAVGNKKGGVGKSAIAVNLACEFVVRNRRVILIDADEQGTAANWCSRGSLPIDYRSILKSLYRNSRLSLKFGGIFIMARSNLTSFSRVAHEESPSRQEKPVESTPAVAAHESREEEAMRIVKRNMYWSMGVGLIPVPWIDMLGTGGLQAKALMELSELYEIPFSQHKAKNIIASLISGLGTPFFAKRIFHMTTFFIPVFGPLAYMAASPLSAGALTYATGKFFYSTF